MSLSTFAFVLCGVLLNAGAQLLLKAGARALGPIEIERTTIVATAIGAALQWPIIAGLACYVVSVGLWIVALSRVDVTVAYPMLSLGYVVNALAAWWLFGEALGPARCAGMLLILAGVFVMARA